VAELRIAEPRVTAVCASSDGVDRLGPIEGARVLRTAPREALVIGPVDAAALRERIGEPGALVDDVSDGWVALVVIGDDAAEVFSRVSELRPPADWLQGEVAKTPSKVIAEPGSLTILAPAHLAAHLEERIRTDAAEVLR
jgi:hypothetical protein